MSRTQHSFRPEVLAPGGSLEALEVAGNAGADAVYLGVGSLNARARAQNLAPAALPGVVDYLRGFATRTYVTLNVPLTVENAAESARTLALCELGGAAAAILRDPLLIEAAARFTPALGRHASTQFGVASPAAARRAAALGCTRVILARELAAADVRRIRRALPDLELEIFVFGALCFGVSGHCLLGAAADGRGGNFGQCSQVCRAPLFDEAGRALGALFSMRDNDLIPRLGELVDLGVHALKIEGRLKPPAWVGCVTQALRRALDRPVVGLTPAERAAFERDIAVLFSRPRTAGWFDGASAAASLTAPEFAGHRGLAVGPFATRGRGRDRTLAFRTPVPLNVRDGLRLGIASPEAPGGEIAVPVAILELRDGRGRPLVVAPAGSDVQARVEAGGRIVSLAIHSADRVRTAYERVATPLPAAVRRGEWPAPRFEHVTVAPDRLTATLALGRFAHTASLPIETAPARGGEFTPALAARYFGAAPVAIAPGLYINPSALKDAVRRLRAATLAGFAAALDQRAAAIADFLLARAARFAPSDEARLLGGVAAVSRVTGLPPGIVRTARGAAFEIVARRRATVVRVVRRGAGSRDDRAGLVPGDEPG